MLQPAHLTLYLFYIIHQADCRTLSFTSFWSWEQSSDRQRAVGLKRYSDVHIRPWTLSFIYLFVHFSHFSQQRRLPARLCAAVTQPLFGFLLRCFIGLCCTCWEQLFFFSLVPVWNWKKKSLQRKTAICSVKSTCHYTHIHVTGKQKKDGADDRIKTKDWGESLSSF